MSTTNTQPEPTFTVTSSEFQRMLATHDRKMAEIYEKRAQDSMERLGRVDLSVPAPAVDLPFPTVDWHTSATREVEIIGAIYHMPTPDEVLRQANIGQIQAGSPAPVPTYTAKTRSEMRAGRSARVNERTAAHTTERTQQMTQTVPVANATPNTAPQTPAQTPAYRTVNTHGCEGGNRTAPRLVPTPAAAPAATPVHTAPLQVAPAAPAARPHPYPQHDARFAGILTEAGLPFTAVRVDLTRDGSKIAVEVYADAATCKVAGIQHKPDLFAWGRDLATVLNGTDKGFRPYSPLGKGWFVNYAGVAVYIDNPTAR